MNDDILSHVRQFSRQTGIVDKNVDLLLDGLCKYPARLFLFTPDNMMPVYYCTNNNENQRGSLDDLFMIEWPGWEKGYQYNLNLSGIDFGRGIARIGKPRGRATLTGISA